MDHSKLWKILQEMGIPDHLTCLLRKKQQLEHIEKGTGSKLGKEYVKAVHQGDNIHIVTSLFNLYTEYFRQNVRLDESLTGIKVAKGYSNNLRYADDTTNWQKVKRN